MEKIISGLFSGNSGYQLVIQQRRCYGHWVCDSFKYRLFLKRNPTFLEWLLTVLTASFECSVYKLPSFLDENFMTKLRSEIKPHCLIPLQINVTVFLTNLSNTKIGVHVGIRNILNGWGWPGFLFLPLKKILSVWTIWSFAEKSFPFFSFPSHAEAWVLLTTS